MIPDRCDVLRIFAIDPSSNHLGVAVIDVDLETNLKYVIDAFTINRKDLLKDQANSLYLQHGETKLVVQQYGEIVLEKLEEYAPDHLTYESAFLRVRNMSAFRALTEIATAIRRACYVYDIDMPITFFKPNMVKINLGVKGSSSNKLDVEKAVLNRKDLRWPYPNLRKVMDEHAFDATAVGILHYETECKLLKDALK